MDAQTIRLTVGAIVASAVLAVVLRLAVVHDQQCLHSHEALRLQPMMAGKALIMLPMKAQVCDQWSGDAHH